MVLALHLLSQVCKRQALAKNMLSNKSVDFDNNCTFHYKALLVDSPTWSASFWGIRNHCCVRVQATETHGCRTGPPKLKKSDHLMMATSNLAFSISVFFVEQSIIMNLNTSSHATDALASISKVKRLQIHWLPKKLHLLLAMRWLMQSYTS